MSPTMCSMCGHAVATVTDPWPAPVCAACDRWLEGLHGELKALEEAKPHIKAAAAEVDAALEALSGPAEAPKPEETEP